MSAGLVYAQGTSGSVGTLGQQWPNHKRPKMHEGLCALCLGQFLEGAGLLKGLEQGRDVDKHFRKIGMLQ